MENNEGPHRVENIVRKGEIAYYKQFHLFSQCFPQLYIISTSKCGIVWKWVNHCLFLRNLTQIPNICVLDNLI